MKKAESTKNHDTTSEKHWISFVLLDDLEPMYGPVHISLKSLCKTEIEKALQNFAEPFVSGKESEGGYIFKGYDNEKPVFCSKFVCERLEETGYYVLNRVEKYYVYAWAIDGKRFEVYSKDCDKKLVDWGDDKHNNNECVVEQIQDENYNENPVVKLLSDSSNATVNRKTYKSLAIDKKTCEKEQGMCEIQ